MSRQRGWRSAPARPATRSRPSRPPDALLIVCICFIVPDSQCLLTEESSEGQCVDVAQALSRVSLFATPWTVARQAPLSVGLSRQEHWSGLSCPPPGGLPNPRSRAASLGTPGLATGFFTRSATVYKNS